MRPCTGDANTHPRPFDHVFARHTARPADLGHRRGPAPAGMGH